MSIYTKSQKRDDLFYAQRYMYMVMFYIHAHSMHKRYMYMHILRTFYAHSMRILRNGSLIEPRIGSAQHAIHHTWL